MSSIKQVANDFQLMTKLNADSFAIFCVGKAFFLLCVTEIIYLLLGITG